MYLVRYKIFIRTSQSVFNRKGGVVLDGKDKELAYNRYNHYIDSIKTCLKSISSNGNIIDTNTSRRIRLYDRNNQKIKVICKCKIQHLKLSRNDDETVVTKNKEIFNLKSF